MYTLFPIFTLLLAVAGTAQAEVMDAAAGGFTIRHVAEVPASRFAAYDAVIEVDKWWDGEHTVSGVAANLYLEPRPQGCFCERLGEDGGLTHLTVSFVNPGVMLRLTGGLGPLGLMGVSGNMTWEFDQSGEVTTLTLTYAVGGYLPQGLDSLADAVDAVLTEQVTRLANYVETGDPET